VGGQRLRHFETLTTANNLALTLSKDGSYAEAIKIQEEVLRISKETDGDEHPYTLTAVRTVLSIPSSDHDTSRVSFPVQLRQCTQSAWGTANPRTTLNFWLVCFGKRVLTVRAGLP
jgi:hypothetical protein